MAKLLPFQREGVRQIYHFRGRALLADEQGLGKTIQSLAWIARLKRRPAIIVTPSSLKYAWQAEARNHFNLRATVLDGKPRSKTIRLKEQIIIINYDILKDWLPILKKTRPAIVILDECHYVKNAGSIRTRATKQLARRASSVVGLSGTPLTNKPVELWSILNIIRPDLFPDFSQYAWRYCSPVRTRWGWKFPGADNRSELFKILRRECMIRRLKKHVAPELPDKVHKIIPLKLGPKSLEEYRRADEQFLSWLREQSPGRANRARKNQALVKVGYLFRLCARLKLPLLVRMIKEFRESHPDKKIVGLTMHTFVIERLQQEFPRCSIVNGQVTGWKRTEAVRRFTSRKDVHAFWGNWKAAGAGLNLQVASDFFSLDLPWTPGDLLQGQDRVHRIGQKRQVVIYYPFLKGTIEEKWMKILQERTDVLQDILDGKAVHQNEDLLNMLLDPKL